MYPQQSNLLLTRSRGIRPFCTSRLLGNPCITPEVDLNATLIFACHSPMLSSSTFSCLLGESALRAQAIDVYSGLQPDPGAWTGSVTLCGPSHTLNKPAIPNGSPVVPPRTWFYPSIARVWLQDTKGLRKNLDGFVPLYAVDCGGSKLRTMPQNK